MRVCDCYRQLEPIQLMVGECLGAKNKPRVDCYGDESRCLFYSDRRRKAKVKTNADRIRAMTDEELASLLMYIADDTDEIGEKDYDAFGNMEWRERMLRLMKQEATDEA